jgi:hypothetical protein
MEWNEPSLVECRCQVGADRVEVVARLGFPRPTEWEAEWACSFQLFGWRDSKVRAAYGIDGLQAITNAASIVRQLLDGAGEVSSSDVPYEFVFPKYVPFAHGLDYHRHLCKVLEEEVEKKEREIEARRLSRE